MQAPSASFVEALSAEEVCPLCLDRYAAADECTCVMCEAPSCPGCAEELDADGAMRCFACRPALSPERSPSQLPVALPRPIQFPVAARVAQGLPPLKFSFSPEPRATKRGGLHLVESLPAQDDEAEAEEVSEADLVVIPAWKQRTEAAWRGAHTAWQRAVTTAGGHAPAALGARTRRRTAR